MSSCEEGVLVARKPCMFVNDFLGQVEKVEVTYAKRSKQVDVKALKDTIWALMEQVEEEGEEGEGNVSMKSTSPPASPATALLPPVGGHLGAPVLHQPAAPRQGTRTRSPSPRRRMWTRSFVSSSPCFQGRLRVLYYCNGDVLLSTAILALGACYR